MRAQQNRKGRASVKTLGIVGVGAFGTFILRHLQAHFDLRLCDELRPEGDVYRQTGIRPVALEACAQSDVVVLCVPVQEIENVARRLAPLLRPGTLVLDVASVKMLPASVLARTLPSTVDIVCTHPLFGPQSGRNGIAGLKISVCNVRGARCAEVSSFLSRALSLDVIETTPERHDRELAYSQGLTHLIGRILIDLDIDGLRQTTRSFDLLMEAVSYVRDDSEQLFAAIEKENPFAAEARRRFFEAAESLSRRLGAPAPAS